MLPRASHQRQADRFNSSIISDSGNNCEEDIFGADIMPFAVHPTCANLAAMDVAQTIYRTQVLQGDSIQIVPGRIYAGGIHQLGLFPMETKAQRTSGEEYEVTLPASGIQSVIMNPPFTKTEGGISKYVEMKKFKDKAGGEVGLWGHFVLLANEFLADGGTYGAVLPMNVRRGREASISAISYLLNGHRFTL